MVRAEECWYKSLAPLMSEVRQQMGTGPVYLSFDIDALDPAFAPGTGNKNITCTSFPNKSAEFVYVIY